MVNVCHRSPIVRILAMCEAGVDESTKVNSIPAVREVKVGCVTCM